MTEISSLITKAHRFTRSARLLLRDGDAESAISRAYYAMFFCAEALLLTKELAFSSHKGVISAFGEHFVKTGLLSPDLGRQLNRAFQERQLGDYEALPSFDAAHTEEILGQAERFVETVEKYLSQLP